MSPLLVFLLLSSVISPILAFPQVSRGVYRRNDNSTSKISVTVYGPNGTDITSSFRTMVYHPPKIVAPGPGLSSRANSYNLNPRGTVTQSFIGRPISGDGFCRSETAKYSHSLCKSSLGVSATTREYLVYCQEQAARPDARQTSRASRLRPTRAPPQPSTANRGGPAGTSYDNHEAPILAEPGSCNYGEICIDGIFAKKGFPMLASCVRDENYQYVEDDDDAEALAGQRAQITITALDERVPERMQQLGIGAAGRPDRYGGSGELGTIKECVQCSELMTDTFAPDTQSLKIEASVMTAGAMAGIFWITLASG